MVNWVSPAELLDLHTMVAELFRASGDPLAFTGERSPGLLDAAANRPDAAFGDRELYDNDRAKLAALVHSINSAHVFRDGNKRTSVAAMVVLLDRDGWRFEASDEEIRDEMIRVATPAPPYDGSSDEAVRALTSWIRSHSRRKAEIHGDIPIGDFLSMVESLGGQWRSTGPSYVIVGPSATRRISRSTPQLASHAAQVYLTDIGLSSARTGVAADEVLRGPTRTRTLIKQYQEVLEMLAAHDRSDD